MRALRTAIARYELPAVEKISGQQSESPFQILLATLLSARTQDATTHAASARLFKRARTPRAVAALSIEAIEQLIYPVGFYRNKARQVSACCDMLVSRFGGRVPSTLDELVTLPGVGRKTANLVMILAFKSERNICVDIHVHRISNRMGWVATKLPDDTEQALYRALAARRIAGAAMDVFEVEPTPPDNPILKLDNVIVSPHSLCHTDECNRLLAEGSFRSAAAYAAGKRPPHLVNPDALAHPRQAGRIA